MSYGNLNVHEQIYPLTVVPTYNNTKDFIPMKNSRDFKWSSNLQRVN